MATTEVDASLRRRAEARLAEHAAPLPESIGDARRLVHELRVHQIELEMQNEELREAREALEIAASVYRAIGESVMIVDGDNRIVAVNEAFTHTTGYEATEAVGRTPRILSSGEHDAAFYQRMWATLESTGRWQGEIRNRRKNGELYAEWLSIYSVLDAQGNLLRRIALFSDINDQKQAAEIIWRQANYDTVTNLPNRRLFLDRLQQKIGKAQRDGGRLALLFIDLDGFKEVNDTLGHDVGDAMLVEAGRRIAASVRATDTVARLGGDEFTVIMAELAEVDRVGEVAQGIVNALAAPYRVRDETIHSSASIGITLFPDDAAQPEELLKHADQAMYVAKRQGRNSFCYFTAQMQTAALERLQLIRDLRVALAEGQFAVWFQPIVDLSSGRIVKAEALLRWQHPSRGLVGPMDFVSVAEEVGLIGAIGDWVFREAARQALLWRERRGGGIQVGINMSPAQFAAGDGHESWLDYLAEIGLPGACMIIEVTEGLLLADRPDIVAKLRRFRDAGLGVAIDDFGTGYSALSYLKKFEIDFIKVDRSFVRDLTTHRGDRALTEAIIAMAHKLDMKVVAEGIETEEQKSFLAGVGCDFGQGFLFARPMPAKALRTVLDRR